VGCEEGLRNLFTNLRYSPLAGAIVRNQGWRTYWRDPKEAVLSSCGQKTATIQDNAPHVIGAARPTTCPT
jgi:hypothetical protein